VNAEGVLGWESRFRNCLITLSSLQTLQKCTSALGQELWAAAEEGAKLDLYWICPSLTLTTSSLAHSQSRRGGFRNLHCAASRTQQRHTDLSSRIQNLLRLLRPGHYIPQWTRNASAKSIRDVQNLLHVIVVRSCSHRSGVLLIGDDQISPFLALLCWERHLVNLVHARRLGWSFLAKTHQVRSLSPMDCQQIMRLGPFPSHSFPDAFY
jgi:hypothetical protein